MIRGAGWLGFRGEIIGKMTKEPFPAAGGPFFQLGKGVAGRNLQAVEGAGSQQTFEPGRDTGSGRNTGIIALVVQKTKNVNPGRPGQHLLLTKVKIGYGK